MRPETLDVLWALLCCLTLFLLLPKRGWEQLGRRLQEVRQARRRHVFGPPAVVTLTNGDEGSLGLLRQRLGAEWWRLLELGVCGWILALAAEEQGRRRRQELFSRWQLAPSGLLFRHLAGEIEADRLAPASPAQSCQFAPKATRHVRPRLVAPSLAWLRESDQPMLVDRRVAIPEPEAVEGPRLQVQTLGLLRIGTATDDLTTDLLKRPTLAFIWQYLLVRALLDQRAAVARDAIADELYPGIDLAQQRKRLSHRLYDFQKLLKPELLCSVAIGELDLRLHLDRCQVDVVRIFELAAEVKESEGLLGRSLLEAIKDLLAVASGEFLPDWEDLEQTVTGGRGTSGDLVRQVRSRLEEARVSLLTSLGEHQFAARNPSQAVLALEEASELRPDRVDVVGKLIEALEAAGQHARASELRGRGQAGREQSA